MNILMLTNTYKPLVGGLEKSIEHFARELRERDHRVMIITPEYPDAQDEEDVIRIPAIQNFNGSDFSVHMPIPGALTDALRDVRPTVIHAHHPFLIGDTAMRLSSKYNVPLVFTHHTLYEENVHYVPGNEEALKRFVIELSTGYANLTDHVIAPSESVERLIKDRGVTTPVSVVPTGIYTERFRRGAGKTFRRKHHIPSEAFVVGHLGRLAPEKNLAFVAEAVSRFLSKVPDARFLIAGKGPSLDDVKRIFEQAGCLDRLHDVGVLQGKDLVDCYHAMDVFAFASHSETQGLVLTEAMAAGLPVVGVDAPGVREVVKDGVNGRLLSEDDADDFVKALAWVRSRTDQQRLELSKACLITADDFSMSHSAEKLLNVYTSLIVEGFFRRSPKDENPWSAAGRLIKAQWDLVKNLTKATGAYVRPGSGEGSAADRDESLRDILDRLPPDNER